MPPIHPDRERDLLGACSRTAGAKRLRLVQAEQIAPLDAVRARRLRLLADRRERAFGPGLFFDPAWHMLLDLFISEADRKAMSVSGVCVGVSAASATALRYLALLEDGGLVQRVPDPKDRRRSFVLLTDHARTRMATVLATLP